MDQPRQSNHGGYREGSGAKPTNRTRLNRAAIEKAAMTGVLPHEILLDMARGNPQKVREVVGKDEDTGLLIIEEKWVSVSVDDQRDAAKAAAPYYAARLATVETVQGLTDEDVDALIKQFATQAGIGAFTGGEGEEEQEEERDSRRGSSGSRQRRRLEL